MVAGWVPKLIVSVADAAARGRLQAIAEPNKVPISVLVNDLRDISVFPVVVFRSLSPLQGTQPTGFDPSGHTDRVWASDFKVNENCDKASQFYKYRSGGIGQDVLQAICCHAHNCKPVQRLFDVEPGLRGMNAKTGDDLSVRIANGDGEGDQADGVFLIVD